MATRVFHMLSGNKVEVPLDYSLSGIFGDHIYEKKAVDFSPGESLIREGDAADVKVPDLPDIVSHLMRKELYKAAFDSLHVARKNGSDVEYQPRLRAELVSGVLGNDDLVFNELGQSDVELIVDTVSTKCAEIDVDISRSTVESWLKGDTLLSYNQEYLSALETISPYFGYLKKNAPLHKAWRIVTGLHKVLRRRDTYLRFLLADLQGGGKRKLGTQGQYSQKDLVDMDELINYVKQSFIYSVGSSLVADPIVRIVENKSGRGLQDKVVKIFSEKVDKVKTDMSAAYTEYVQLQEGLVKKFSDYFVRMIGINPLSSVIERSEKLSYFNPLVLFFYSDRLEFAYKEKVSLDFHLRTNPGIDIITGQFGNISKRVVDDYLTGVMDDRTGGKRMGNMIGRINELARVLPARYWTLEELNAKLTLADTVRGTLLDTIGLDKKSINGLRRDYSLNRTDRRNFVRIRDNLVSTLKSVYGMAEVHRESKAMYFSHGIVPSAEGVPVSIFFGSRPFSAR
ncbi:MAG: hypothetical protein ABIC04_00100 [Nanoarchaeota archaeon]